MLIAQLLVVLSKELARCAALLTPVLTMQWGESRGSLTGVTRAPWRFLGLGAELARYRLHHPGESLRFIWLRKESCL